MLSRLPDQSRKITSYSLAPSTITKIKKAAKKLKIPASRYVEAIMLEYIEAKGKKGS